MQNILLSFLAVGICSTVSYGQSIAPPKPGAPLLNDQLSSYIHRSLATHPDLMSMRAMVAAESSRAVMARSWMNPDLNLGLMDVPNNFKFNQDPATAFEIGVMQHVPFTGKLKSAGAAADARIAAASLDLETARQQMAAMVAMNYYDLAALVQIDSLLNWGRELTEEMKRSAEAMVASGMAAQSDVHRAELERDNWQLKLIANRNDIERGRAALAYAVGSQIDKAEIWRFRLPPDFTVEDQVITPPNIDASPSVRSAAARFEAADAELARARREWYPDADVMLKYGLKPDLKVAGGTDPMTGSPLPPGTVNQNNMISLGVTVSLPLFSRGNQKAQIAEMQAMRSAAAANLANERLAKMKGLQAIQAAYTGQLERDFYIRRSLIPRAEALFNSALADYQAGKTPFMELTQARMSLVMAKMELTMARAEAWSLCARWRAALGQLVPTDKDEINE
jgi:outer membrane protein TolC